MRTARDIQGDISDLPAPGLAARVGNTGLLGKSIIPNNRREFVVRDFGATGDGVTDDYRPIQNAIDACIKDGGGTVFLPAGFYLINSSLDLSAAAGLPAKAVTIAGAGTSNTVTSGATWIKNASGTTAIKAVPLVYASSFGNITIKDMYIRNTVALGASDYTIDAQAVVKQFTVKNVILEGWNGGASLAGNGIRFAIQDGSWLFEQVTCSRFDLGTAFFISDGTNLDDSIIWTDGVHNWVSEGGNGTMISCFANACLQPYQFSGDLDGMAILGCKALGLGASSVGLEMHKCSANFIGGFHAESIGTGILMGDSAKTSPAFTEGNIVSGGLLSMSSGGTAGIQCSGINNQFHGVRLYIGSGTCTNGVFIKAATASAPNGNVSTAFIDPNSPGTFTTPFVDNSTNHNTTFGRGPGELLSAQTLTAASTNIASGVAATPTTLITLPSNVYDGTPIALEAYIPRSNLGTATSITYSLWDNTAAAAIGDISFQISGSPGPTYARIITTPPSSGARVYSLRAYANAAATTANAACGAGGVGVLMPGYLRAVRAPNG